MAENPEQVKRRDVSELCRAYDFAGGLIARLQVMKQQCADRYLEVRHPQVIPVHDFTEAMDECIFLYVEARFFGAVTLAQAVAEGIVKFVCRKNNVRLKGYPPKMAKNLAEKRIVSPEFAEAVARMWKYRNDFHHMNTAVADIKVPLDQLAKSNITGLTTIVNEVFGGNWSRDGRYTPDKPQYW